MARLVHRSPGRCVGVAARVAASRQHWSRGPIYTLRACARPHPYRLPLGLTLTLGSLCARGGGCWLLTAAWGILGAR